MPRVNRVFISYSRVDSGAAHAIAASLKQRNIDVWIDAQLEVGQDFVQEIERALFASSAVLLLISPEYLSSEWGNYERALALKVAQETGKRVLPVLISKVDTSSLPASLRRLVMLDATEGIEQVAMAVQKALESKI